MPIRQDNALSQFSISGVLSEDFSLNEEYAGDIECVKFSDAGLVVLLGDCGLNPAGSKVYPSPKYAVGSNGKVNESQADTLRDQLQFSSYRAKRASDPSYTFRAHLREIGGAIEE